MGSDGCSLMRSRCGGGQQSASKLGRPTSTQARQGTLPHPKLHQKLHRYPPTLADEKASISSAGRRPPAPVRGLGGSRSIPLSYEGSDYAQEQLCRTRQYLNNCATAGRRGPRIPAAAPDAKLQHSNAHRRPPTPESRSQNRCVTEATGIPALAHAA